MGIRPSFADSTYVGGSSFVVHVAHAVAAIAAGYCEVAMITHGQAGRSGRTRPAEDRARPYVQYEVPYGITHPPMYYSMMCRRYMHDYGEDRTREAMAEIAVATRKWARLNPRALMHDRPMELQDYHDSPWITLALPPAGLLSRHGRRRGGGDNDRGARPRPADEARAGCWARRRGTSTTWSAR